MSNLFLFINIYTILFKNNLRYYIACFLVFISDELYNAFKKKLKRSPPCPLFGDT